MQCQIFIAVNSTPLNFKQIFFDKFLCPHYRTPFVYPKISSKIFDYLVRVHNDKGLELCGREGTGE